MAWVVNKNGTEIVFPNKPSKGFMFWYNLESPNNRVISIPKKSIKKLVDRNLSWEDELVELK